MGVKVKLFFIIQIFGFYLPGVYLESAKEMLDAVQNSDIVYWPHLSCLPHGPMKYFKKYIKMNTAESPDKLLKTIGLASLFKLERVGKTCDKILAQEEYKKKFSNSDAKLRCRKMCILEKLNFISNESWHSKSLEMGDLTLAMNSIRELLTGPGLAANFTMDLDLTVETTARYLFNSIRAEYFSTESLPCWTDSGSPPNEFHEFMGSEIDALLEFPCKTMKKIKDYNLPYYPPPMTEILALMPIMDLHESEENPISEYWPKLTCLKNWMTEMPEEGTDEDNNKHYGVTGFYRLNRDCKEQYNNTQFKKLYGGDEAAESCRKVCILSTLGILQLSPERQWPLENLFEGKYQVSVVMKKEDHLKEILEVNKDKESSMNLFEFAKNGFYTVGSKAKSWSLPCFANEWMPVFKDVEEFFKKLCHL